jgi:uncharacterized membrane protein
MSIVHKSIEVDVPVSTAYNQWTQFESFPQFMHGVESITQIDDTHTHWVTKIAGVRREFDAEITEQEPDNMIAWRSAVGDTGGHAGRVKFEALSPMRTRIDIALEWEPDGLVEKVGSATGIDQHQVNADTERFKKLIERQGQESGSWRGEVHGGVPR